MLVSLLMLFVLALGGSVLTYVYGEKDSLLVRLCAGNVIGTAIFGLVVFLLACLVGFTSVTILVALLITLSPLIFLTKRNWRAPIMANWSEARRNLDDVTTGKILNFAFYAGILLLLYFFFDRAMIETPKGIFTGGSQNLGDLPFHLGAIFSFTEGNNFPPENPSFAFAKFTYPFMTDLVTACFVQLGAGVREAMLVQNITLGFSLVVLFEKFVFALTGNARAGKFAPVILLFSGGLGFVLFFREYWQDGRGLFEFLWNLSKDYTLRPKGIRWGNSLTTLFMTQRSLLLGMPLTLIILTFLWKIFNAETQRRGGNGARINIDEESGKPLFVFPYPSSVIFLGLLAGTLPLIHVHSLAVLFVVCAFLFFLSADKWRAWLSFGIATAIVAVPQLVWVMTGSATQLAKFVGWNFGWDAQGENVFVFWWRNLGLFIPLLLLGIYFTRRHKGTEKQNSPQRHEDTEAGNEQKTKNEEQRTKDKGQRTKLLLFYLPFVFIFVVANLFKLAPWEWDNIKVLIYWFVASIPFVAWLLARAWEKGAGFKFVSAACLIVLIFSGALDVWRVVSRQINYEVFNRDAVSIAGQIKQNTPPKALFLNAPTYNSAVVLSGRRSLMRYIGNLSSYGIDYEPREHELQKIYEGSSAAESLLRKNRIEYVLIGPEERANQYFTVNDEYFAKFPVAAEAGEYKVYQIK